MSTSPPTRAIATLSESTHRRLNKYTLAASAAGVGVLALARSAEAKIVYTPAHINIAPNHSILLDLNHDGKTDFFLRNILHTTASFRYDRLSILPQRDGNEIWGHNSTAGAHYASALAAGIQVGPPGAFSLGLKSMAFGGDLRGSYYCQGKWNNVQKRYLGLKFTIQGKTHFGWARLNATCVQYKINALLTGYAYETIPNKSIATGKTKGPCDPDGSEPANPASLTAATREPATLGSLAMGSPVLSIWRRKESLGSH